jgi:hypothetical protein
MVLINWGGLGKWIKRAAKFWEWGRSKGYWKDGRYVEIKDATKTGSRKL